MMNMGARDAYKFTDDMALSQQQWSLVRGNTRVVPRILETDLATKVAAQVEAKFAVLFETL
jgi:negative regulator of sigma E activity